MTSSLKIIQEYSTLEQARLDFQVLRVQFFMGFLCAALSLTVLFAHLQKSLRVSNVPGVQVQIQALTELKDAPGAVASMAQVKDASPIDRATNRLNELLSRRIHIKLANFVIYLMSTLFLGLVILELTGKNGNRLGAVPALWAMLLFTVVPNGANYLGNTALRADLLDCLFLLVAIFAVLRFDLSRQKTLLVIGGVALAAAIVELSFQIHHLWHPAVRPDPAISQIIRRCSDNPLLDLLGVKAPGDNFGVRMFFGDFERADFSFLSLALGMTTALGIFRLLSKTMTLRIALAALVCLASIGVGLTFASGSFNSISLDLEGEPFSMFARAALCAFLALASLQASGKTSRTRAGLINLIAVIFLMTIFLEWAKHALNGA